MTKAQALKDFKDNIMPDVIKQYGKNDKVAKCEAWNDYTDILCKNGDITLQQYNSWESPF